MNRKSIPAFRTVLAVAVGAYGLWAAFHALGVLTLPVGAALGEYWPALVGLYALLTLLFHSATGGARGFYGAVLAASIFLLLAHLRAIGITSGTAWQLIIAAALIGLAVSLLTGHGVVTWHGGPKGNWNFVFDSKSKVPDLPGWHGSGHGSHDDEDGSDWDDVGSTTSYVGEVTGPGAGQELRNHRYRQGMGDITMDLSSVRLRPGETHIVLDCGMGEIQLLVPEGMAIHLRGQVKVGEVSLFDRTASGMAPSPLEYVSQGYEEAERRVRVDMLCGMGEVTASWVR